MMTYWPARLKQLLKPKQISDCRKKQAGWWGTAGQMLVGLLEQFLRESL